MNMYLFVFTPPPNIMQMQLTELPLAPTFDLPMERSHSVASSILMSSGTSTGLGSANSSYPSSPLPFLNDNISMSIEDISSISTKRAAPGKAKKKRRPKPRMAELSTEQAQAKRDANRESARKCRERKRQREKVTIFEYIYIYIYWACLIFFWFYVFVRVVLKYMHLFTLLLLNICISSLF